MKRRSRRLGLAISGLLMVYLYALPGLVQAADGDVENIPDPSNTLLLPTDQLVAALVGIATMLIMYGVNYLGPQVRDTVKGPITLAATAVTGALYTLVESGGLGFNQETAQTVGIAIVAAFWTHGFIFKPTGIAVKLGAGRNRQNEDVVADAPGLQD